MMSFLGLSLANALVKLVFLDPGTTVPQTRTLAVADRLPALPGTIVSGGVLIGLAAIVAVHLVMTRTASASSCAWSGPARAPRSMRGSGCRC